MMIPKNAPYPPLASPLGLIAGSGDLPKKIIEMCCAEGRSLFLFALQGQTPPSLTEGVPHVWLPLGQLGAFLKEAKRQNIVDLMVVGALTRPDLRTLSLDWEGMKFLGQAHVNRKGDDGLLSALAGFLEKKGFRLIPPSTLIGSSLLCPEGILTQASPSPEDWQDIQRGIEILSHMGPLDVGQSIVIQHGQVLGIEAIEGTQALLQRIRSYKLSSQGGVLVKGSKIGQHTILDLPTVGPETLSQLKEAGLSGMALEAFKTQMIDGQQMVEMANQAHLFIQGIKFSEDLASLPSS